MSDAPRERMAHLLPGNLGDWGAPRWTIRGLVETVRRQKYGGSADDQPVTRRADVVKKR
jgi:hypothetical protein